MQCIYINKSNPGKHPYEEAINLALRDHQKSLDDWDFSKLAADLHLWAERMIFEFKLETPVPALMIEGLRKGTHGRFRHGRNSFGLRNEIAIDRTHLKSSEYWHVLGTLLHEILHSWQETNGIPPSLKSWNYHNKEFREKAKDLGLEVDRWGHTYYLPGETPFLQLLEKYGIEVPEIPMPEMIVPREGKSKLTLYICPCGVRVRVGRKRFNARCLDCGGIFMPAK